MRRSSSLVSAFLGSLLVVLPAAAQPPAGGAGFGGPPRLPGPNPELARQAAVAAVKACERMGYKTMATVVDAAGQPVVAMTADPGLNNALAPESVRRARISATFHAASSDIADRIGLDAGVYYLVQGDARLRPVKAGGVPFGATGAIGVAGGPDALTDEVCARAGIKAIAAQLNRRGPGARAPVAGGGAVPSEEGGPAGRGRIVIP